MDLLELEPEDFELIGELPFDDDPSWWHTNRHIRVTTEGKQAPELGAFSGIVDMENISNILIFQRADASEEWFAVAIHESDLQTLLHFATGEESTLWDAAEIELPQLLETQDTQPNGD